MPPPRQRRAGSPPAVPLPLKSHLLAFAAIALAIGLVYLPSISGEFQFDDAMGIERGGWLLPQGQELRTMLRTLTHWSDRGLVTATYQFNYWTAGGNERRMRSINSGGEVGLLTPPFHVFNMVVHVEAAGALYALLAWMTLRLGRPSWIAPTLGTVLFALHPLGAESVAYISARTGAMAACFGFWGIAALLAYGGPRPDGSPQTLRSRALGTGLLALGTWLAIGCKETGWMIPVMGATALAWSYLGDWRAMWRDWGGGMLAGATLFAIGMGLWITKRGFLSDAFLQQYASTYGVPASQALGCHAATQLNIWWTTHLPRLLLPLGPWHPSVDLDPPLLRSLEGGSGLWVAAEALGTLGAALWALRWHKTLTALGLAWIALAVLPVSFPSLQDATTERHTYMPLAGVALVAADLMSRLASRRRLLLAGLGAGAILLALLTAMRTAQWRSETYLWGSAVRDVPQKPRPHYNMAKAMVRQAIECAKTDPARSRDLGSRAERGLRLTLRAAPTFHLAHGAMARELERQGRLPEAVEEYRLSVRCHEGALMMGEAPLMHAGQITSLTYAGARCLHNLGRDEEAVKDYNTAISFHIGALRCQGPSSLHAEHAVQLICLLAKFHRDVGHIAQARQALRDGLAWFPKCRPFLEMLNAMEGLPERAPGEKH